MVPATRPDVVTVPERVALWASSGSGTAVSVPMQLVPKKTFTDSSAFQMDCRTVVVDSSPSMARPFVPGASPFTACTVRRHSRSVTTTGFFSSTRASSTFWQPKKAIAAGRAIITVLSL